MLMDESPTEDKTQQVILRLHTLYVSRFSTIKQTEMESLNG